MPVPTPFEVLHRSAADLAGAVRTYCDSIDAIGASTQPAQEHIDQLDDLEKEMRLKLAHVETTLKMLKMVTK